MKRKIDAWNETLDMWVHSFRK